MTGLSTFYILPATLTDMSYLQFSLKLNLAVLFFVKACKHKVIFTQGKIMCYMSCICNTEEMYSRRERRRKISSAINRPQMRDPITTTPAAMFLVCSLVYEPGGCGGST